MYTSIFIGVCVISKRILAPSSRQRLNTLIISIGCSQATCVKNGYIRSLAPGNIPSQSICVNSSPLGNLTSPRSIMSNVLKFSSVRTLIFSGVMQSCTCSLFSRFVRYTSDRVTLPSRSISDNFASFTRLSKRNFIALTPFLNQKARRADELFIISHSLFKFANREKNFLVDKPLFLLYTLLQNLNYQRTGFKAQELYRCQF